MKSIKHFIINGGNVVIMHQLHVQYVKDYVLVYKHIYAFGVIVLSMVLAMEIKINVILGI